MMKKILLIGTFALGVIGMNAQEVRETIVESKGDTIMILKGTNDVKIKIYEDIAGIDGNQEEKIYEGVYLTRTSENRNTILDALPFAPKPKYKKNYFERHVNGLYGGFSTLSNNFMSFRETNHANLNLSKSWEIGFNLLSSQIVLTPSNHWGITFGLGWGYRSYRLDGNEAFLKNEESTIIAPGTEELVYSKSRLRHFYFRIPICLEFQTRINGSGRLFAAIGPEVELRHGIKSMAKVNGDGETLANGMHVRPFTVNMLAQVGYGDIGLYMRCDTQALFANNKGPKVMPCSFGVMWYW